MHLYLIRHGESFVNLNGWVPSEGESYDASLTDLGKRQVAALAAWLPKAIPHFDGLYASTLQRARETAAPLADAYKLEISFDDRLREFGNTLIDESPIPPDLLPKEPSYSKKYEFPYLSTAPSIERAESYMHFRSRIGVFLNEMIERYPEGRVAAVCHGGVVNAVFDHIFNVGPYRRCEVWVRNTAYCHFQYRFIEHEEPWLLHACGCTEHLAGIR